MKKFQRINNPTSRGMSGNPDLLWEVRGPKSLKLEYDRAWVISGEDGDMEDRELQLLAAHSVIKNKLRRLPEMERTMMRMYLKGDKYCEIAKVFLLHPTTVARIIKKIGASYKKFIPTFTNEEEEA